MSTAVSESTVEQQQRAAAFAAQERQHLQDLASTSPPTWLIGHGAINYSMGLAETPDGFAELGWSVADQYGTYCYGPTDWVGIFANANQAMVNPSSNVLGGSGGWTWSSVGGPFTTDVALQPGMVAAYVVKNAQNNYVSVAISPPWPSPSA